MSNYIQEFAIAIGLDADALQRGLLDAQKAVNEALGRAKAGLEQITGASASTSSAASASLSAVDKGFDKVADSAEEAAQEIKSEFASLPPVIDVLKERVLGLVGIFTAALGSAEMFSNYLEKADGLGKLSQQLGINERELDAWAKANEAAGGSAEALFESLKAYYDQTGRPAEEFFKLGEKIEGMSRRQAQAFLQAQGVAWDAIPVFLEGQKKADELVAKYRQTAFTAQDAQNARAFKVAWMDFKIAAQDVGNVLVRAVLPAVKWVVEALTGIVTWVRENIRFVALLGVGLTAVFGAKLLGSIKGAITAMKAFAVANASALAPLAAVAAAITVVALAIDDFIAFANGDSSVIGNVFKKMGMSPEDIESIRSAIKTVVDAFSNLWEKLKPLIGDAVISAFKGIAFVIGLIASALVAVIGFVVALGAGFVRTAKDMWESAKETASKIGDYFSEIGDSLGDTLSKAWDKFVDWLSGWGDKIREYITDPLSHAFDGFTDWITEALEGAWGFIESFFGRMIDLIKGKVGGAVKGLFSGIGEFFGIQGDDKNTPSIENTSAAQAVLAQRGLTQNSSVQNTTTLNMPMTFNNAQNPQAVGAHVQATMRNGFGRAATLNAQSVRGVNTK